MAVQVFSRPERVTLKCWGCVEELDMKADPVLSLDTNIWELLMLARERGWVAHRDGDEVFALCPSCVNVALAKLLRPLYDSPRESRLEADSPSARGSAGVFAPAGLWRRIVNLLNGR